MQYKQRTWLILVIGMLVWLEIMHIIRDACTGMFGEDLEAACSSQEYYEAQLDGDQTASTAGSRSVDDDNEDVAGFFVVTGAGAAA